MEKLILGLVLLLPYVMSEPCQHHDIGYGFSECDEDLNRSVYFYWKKECEPEFVYLPRARFYLDCRIECGPGEFLDFDLNDEEQICSRCKENTYSIGGGEDFLGSRADWLNVQDNFAYTCYTSSYISFNENTNCTSWSTTPDGSFLISGETEAEEWIQSSMIYTTSIVKDGLLRIKYKKTTKMYSDFKNGELTVLANGEDVHSDSEEGQDTWKEISVPLEIGQTEIEILYEKYNGEDTDDLSAQISEFEIRGTQYSSHGCEACPDGYSLEGSSRCDLCGFGMYLDPDTSVCTECPEGTFSFAGAIGVYECDTKPACSERDYTAHLLPCSDGKQLKEYRWHYPKICQSDDENDLPHPEEVDCPPCNPGLYRTEEGNLDECLECPDGYFRSSEMSQDSCAPCEAGTYAVNMLNYTSFSPLPEGFYTYCKTFWWKDCDTSDGWIGTESNMFSGYNLEDDVLLYAERKVNIVQEGAYV